MISVARLLVVALVATLALSACRAPTVDFSEGAVTADARAYGKALKRWTRSGGAYRDLDTRLEVTATYRSWEWTHLAVERLTEDQALPAAEKAALKARSLDAYRARYEFLVAGWSMKRYWNDLDHGKDSSWTVVLEDDRGRSMPADEIEAISETPRKLPAELKLLFPYIDTFAKVYEIRFNRPTGTEPGPRIDADTRFFTLRFGGPLGRIDLVWTAE